MDMTVNTYTNFADIKRDEYRYWQRQPLNLRFRQTLDWTLENLGVKKANIHIPDYVALLEELERFEVEYLIIGGYAVNLYAQPRFTHDLDLWIHATEVNAQRVYRALANFGAPVSALSWRDFSEPEKFFRFGETLGFDIHTTIPGVSFTDAWPRRLSAGIEGTELNCNYIGRDDLIAAKRAAGRLRDMADVDEIEQARKTEEE